MDLTYTHLEVLAHHLGAGVVEDGNQISKQTRNDLIHIGMLRRTHIPDRGCCLTIKGLHFIKRKMWVYRWWTRINRWNELYLGGRLSWGFRYRLFRRFIREAAV